MSDAHPWRPTEPRLYTAKESRARRAYLLAWYDRIQFAQLAGATDPDAREHAKSLIGRDPAKRTPL